MKSDNYKFRAESQFGHQVIDKRVERIIAEAKKDGFECVEVYTNDHRAVFCSQHYLQRLQQCGIHLQNIVYSEGVNGLGWYRITSSKISAKGLHKALLKKEMNYRNHIVTVTRFV